MPLAVQYGMSLNDFWHGDMRLLEVYQKAYLRNKTYTAWMNGQYDYAAFAVVMSNAFAKKGQSKEEYPKYDDPIEKYKKPKSRNFDSEYEFRKQQAEQQAWLFNR